MNIEEFKHELSISKKLDILLEHATKLIEENVRLKKENNVLRETSPLMCTMQLEKENERLKEENEIMQNVVHLDKALKFREEHQRYKQALERIKEKCKDGRAYTIEAEVYHIAHVELKGDK